MIDVHKSSYAVYCSAKNIDTLSIEGILPSKRKGLSEQVALNEVYALARLTFHENLLIGQETSAHCPHQRVSVLSGLT